MKIKPISKFRFYLAISILIITPLGFGAKLYSGPISWWINDFFGGFLYVVFWCLVAALAFPTVRDWKIAGWVLLGTSFLECLQLWHPPFLEWIRSFFIGRTLIGTTFVWMDFPYYLFGSVAGAWLLKGIKKKAKTKFK